MEKDCGTVLAQRHGKYCGGPMSRLELTPEFPHEPAHLVIHADYPAARLISDRLDAARLLSE